MSSTAAGSNSGRQSSAGLLSAMASLNPFGKSKSERRASGSTRVTKAGETVPRSYGINGGLNRSSSERTTGDPPQPGIGVADRRTGDVSVTQPTTTSSFSGKDMGTASSEGKTSADGVGAGVATRATVAGYRTKAGEEDSPSTLFAGKATDIELGFPAVYIIGYWKQKEEKKFAARDKYLRPPPDYAAHRRYMVDWLSEVGEQLDLQMVTIHSAVSFLDELMMLLDYNTKDWHLYAVCCLSVAAKYEEAECNMPMISELADATEMSLTTPIVTRGELDLVQNKMHWDVSRVTAMHFLGYYTSQGVTFPEDTCQGRRLVEKVVAYMKKYVDFFANLCQQDYKFQSYRPSHIAAASIFAARRALCIKPLWRNELVEMTGYKMEEIVECAEELWNFYEKMFPTHKPLRTEPSPAMKKAAADQRLSTVSMAVATNTEGRVSTAPSSGSNTAMGSSAHVVGADSWGSAAASSSVTAPASVG